jgi:hypothetical protein
MDMHPDYDAWIEAHLYVAGERLMQEVEERSEEITLVRDHTFKGLHASMFPTCLGCPAEADCKQCPVCCGCAEEETR